MKKESNSPQLFEYVFYIYIEINLYFCGIKGAIEVLGWIADPFLKALVTLFFVFPSGDWLLYHKLRTC